MSDSNGTERKRTASWRKSTDTSNLVLEMADGRKAHFDMALVVPQFMQLPEMGRLLVMHGAQQKLADKGSNKDVDIHDAALEGFELLKNGHWSQRGTGEGVERTTLFAEAYAQFHQLDVADARAKINATNASEDATRKANLEGWKKHPEIVRIMRDIQLRKAQEAAKAARANAKEAPRPELAAL